MFWGVLSTFFSGISTIFRKKSMSLNTWLGEFGFMFIGWAVPLIYILYFILTWEVWGSVFNVKIIGITATICIFWILWAVISQYVYKQEKISTVAPYENLNKILSIIISFFIFSDVSLVSLGIAIFVVLVIFFSSFDFKTREVPRTIQIFSLNQLMISINTILIGYLLLQISSIEYFVTEGVIGVVLLLFVIIFNKDIVKMTKLGKDFYKSRVWAALIGNLGYVISLYVISEFGVTINILLSFLYLWFTLILSYLILWDKPTKKSILVSIFVTFLVGLWFYFK